MQVNRNTCKARSLSPVLKTLRPIYRTSWYKPAAILHKFIINTKNTVFDENTFGARKTIYYSAKCEHIDTVRLTMPTSARDRNEAIETCNPRKHRDKHLLNKWQDRDETKTFKNWVSR